MSIGISPKLPLQRDGSAGHELNKTYRDAIRQNFKNLILTVPGERIMDPNFGVGLVKYLFEQNSEMLRSEIRGKINQQVNIYMPFLKINEVSFFDDDLASNTLNMRINYTISSFNLQDFLDITL